MKKINFEKNLRRFLYSQRHRNKNRLHAAVFLNAFKRNKRERKLLKNVFLKLKDNDDNVTVRSRQQIINNFQEIIIITKLDAS